MPFDPRQHLISLKGKDYLPVAARLVWLNEEAERYTITTNILRLEDTYAVVQATVTVFDKDGNAIKTATALKREDKTHFMDFLEKSETGSVGRALGMLGYGTQFAPEFDEMAGQLEPRIVDTPQAAPKPEAASSLANLGLKPASSLGAPTNKRKPQPVEEPAAETAPAKTAKVEELDIDDGLEEYDHGAVPDDELFSEAKVRRLLSIAGKLFNLKGEALETRVLEASSKILKKSIADVHALHWRDGNEVMKQLEETAIKRGVWERSA
jgi:hypothetical protein